MFRVDQLAVKGVLAATAPDPQGRLPWTLRRDVDPDADRHLFQRESFVCVTGEVALDAASPADFVDRAVGFMNERLWGTLAAAITVPDRWQREHADDLDAAIARLRYGTIGINQWPGVSYALMSPPWGAYPGSRLEDVGADLMVANDLKNVTEDETSVNILHRDGSYIGIGGNKREVARKIMDEVQKALT